ncbi:MAG: hypothetical protein ACYCPW_01795 [Nitrososphaerales archaeon]
MTPPKPKQVSKFAPDILRKMIPRTLERHYSMMSYDSHDGGCPRCKSDHVVGFGWLPKTFCTIITERGGFANVNVRVRRYLCMHCKHTFLATDSPFYDGCKYGKPIVDLCLALVASNPYNRVESILMQYGVQVDRDTVKRYALAFRDRSIKKAGIPVMDNAKIGVNILKLLFDVENVKELKEKYPKAKYDSVMDETYPRKKGAKKALTREKYIRRVTGEKQSRFPDSFTLASSYMNHLECFSSISCRNSPFNSIVAETLAKPLIGSDAIVTDGSHCYDNARSYYCLFHKMGNFFAKDPFLNRQRSDESLPWCVLSSYMEDIYSFAENEYEEWLGASHPDLVDSETGKYIGATTTNAMEGGNWRMKYELRSSYQNDRSIESRCILMALKDSLQTFKEGKPHMSFANINGRFDFQRTMGEAETTKIAGEPVEKYIYR